MHLCYIDESGTSAIPGNTSHFVLCGISIPISMWNRCERDIIKIKEKYCLKNDEIHTGWIARNYTEQNKIPGFETLSYIDRRSSVLMYRTRELLRLQKEKSSSLKQVKKTYQKTNPYIHLTFSERKDFLNEVATKVGGWSFARIFAECIDKTYFNPIKAAQTIDEQAFEQVVSRFESYLSIMSTCSKDCKNNYGLIIHDNNDTIAKRHTDLMKLFRQRGTLWTRINCIIETPLFVDSALTAMVQIADLCAYSLRRYLENGDEELFREIYKRADRKRAVAVGIRHFSSGACTCEICKLHKNGK